MLQKHDCNISNSIITFDKFKLPMERNNSFSRTEVVRESIMNEFAGFRRYKAIQRMEVIDLVVRKSARSF